MTHVFEHIDELRMALANRRSQGERIGLVPTMGALHNGHAQLIKQSMQDTDCTVVSIFVNPLQFNNQNDLKAYPKDLKADIAFLERLNCEMVFIPSATEIYPNQPNLNISFGSLDISMEGAFREGHFNGVAIIIMKLFHTVEPNIAYFGQKDLQQYLIIKTLVKDLNFNIDLECVPIVRETSGLAISSRNQRLSANERKIASQLFKSLKMGKKLIMEGHDIITVRDQVYAFLHRWQEICVEYYELVDKNSLKTVDQISENGEYAICLAAHVGSVRLIDNILLNN